MILSVYLTTAGLAWVVGQTVKYSIGIVKNKRWSNASTIFNSGNMPSVHTATVVALTFMIGLKNGPSSALFALSLLFTAVVAYDAMGVRRAAGEQGLALRKLLNPKAKKPYLALGHTPLEVAVGALIGALVSLIVAFFTFSF